jgi:hypothetical protein
VLVAAIDNHTATIEAFNVLVTTGQTVQIWRDKGFGARKALFLDGVVYRASWFEDRQKFVVMTHGLRGEFDTALSLPVEQRWQFTPLTSPTT